MNKDLTKNDILNKYSGHTIEETVDGSFYIKTLKDGSSNEVNSARAMSEADAFTKLRRSLGYNGVVPSLTTTQINALSLGGTDHGQQVFDQTLEVVKTWNNIASEWE